MQIFKALKVAIVGTGYVGLTTGVALAHLGHKVVGIDNNQAKVSMLSSGKSPIHEAHIENLMHSSSNNLIFTNDMRKGIKDADVVLIAVGTPPKLNGEANTEYVEEAARQIANVIEENQKIVIVVKSTVPIGSNLRVTSVVERVLLERGVQASVSFASNPEFLREGMAIHDTFYPDRIVIGADTSTAVETLRVLYYPLSQQNFIPPRDLPRPTNLPLPPFVITDTASAEMIKYASNAFLAIKISFANEISGLCERVGADIKDVTQGMGLDTRIGTRFLQAGIGWGGSCFPKDSQALQAVAADYGYTMPIIQAAREVNARQRVAIIEKLQKSLKILRGRKIAIFGLAFKPGTDDTRDSAGMDILRTLIERDVHVSAYDPVALNSAMNEIGSSNVEWCTSPYDAAKNADAILLATDWEEFLYLDWSQLASLMRTAVIVDGRNHLDPFSLRDSGFNYIGVGR